MTDLVNTPKQTDLIIEISNYNIIIIIKFMLQLSFILDIIAAHPSTDNHGRRMLREWLQTDPDASWERLDAVLTMIGQRDVPTIITTQVADAAVSDSTHSSMVVKLQAALEDLQGTQWYDLGLKLQLPPSTLDTIAADHESAHDCKRMMLIEWLSKDPEASWEKLAAALTTIGHETTASCIRRRSVAMHVIAYESKSDSGPECMLSTTLLFKLHCAWQNSNIIVATLGCSYNP